MSIINSSRRSTVVFDASNKQHREYFKEFRLKASWKDCPVVFKVEQPYLSATDMIKDKLLDYYMKA